MSNDTHLASKTVEDNLTWLQRWYADQCDGEWEHAYGISIGTLDNPGWVLEINLTKTHLANVTFSPAEREGEEDWFICRLDQNVFKAHGGARNLDDIIGTFRKLATNAEKKQE